jgi:rhodanese-related sulfurtransferase
MSRDAPSIPETSPDAIPEDAALVDVRPPAEREGDIGFPPGSRAFAAEDVGALAEALEAAYPERPIVLLCLSGRRSGEVALQLQERGMARASSLAGGVLAWRAAGLPTVGVEEPDPEDVPVVDSAEELPRAVIACFVAETVEVALDRGDDMDDGLEDVDPVEEVEALFAPAISAHPLDKRGLYAALDQLAELARFRGHPLERIASNVDRMRRAIDGL